MNYSKILEELNNASLFELYRLQQAISRSLEDPVRIRKIKDSLKVGQDIEYFEAEENRLIEASIVELKRTRALVKNRHDGKLWNIPFYLINLDHADIAISSPTGKLDRNSLKVGDKVAFKDRKGNELFGEVIKLNQKTAGVLVGTMPIRLAPKARAAILSGLVAHIRPGYGVAPTGPHLLGICMAESRSTQAAERHEHARGRTLRGQPDRHGRNDTMEGRLSPTVLDHRRGAGKRNEPDRRAAPCQGVVSTASIL